jgi:hypothetical protein
MGVVDEGQKKEESGAIIWVRIEPNVRQRCQRNEIGNCGGWISDTTDLELI